MMLCFEFEDACVIGESILKPFVDSAGSPKQGRLVASEG